VLLYTFFSSHVAPVPEPARRSSRSCTLCVCPCNGKRDRAV